MRGRRLLFREIAFITHPTVHSRKQVAAALSAAVTSTKLIGDAPNSQAEPTKKKDSSRTPAALRERGSGGEALLSEKRPLPQNLPTVNLFGREREGGDFSLREAPSLANTLYFSLNPMTMLVPTPGWLWISKVEALRFMLGSPMPAPKPRDRASSLAVE